MKRRALILGSGVCGLAAGLRIRELSPDTDITMLEAEDRVGGLARSLTVGGLVADMGPHRIHTELPDVQEFLKDIAGPELIQVERRSRMWIRNRWIEYPPQPLEALKVFGPFTLAKALASWGMGRVGRILSSKEPKDNFESVMTGAFGSELYRLIVMDYTRKVWKIPPRGIHGDIARVRVSAGGLDKMIKRVLGGEKEGEETALKKFYYIPGGVENLAKRMEDRLRGDGTGIRTGARVQKLERTDNQTWRVKSDSGETFEADALISTVPLPDLVEWLQEVTPHRESLRHSREMKFIANFLVCVVVDRPSVTNCQWLYFPGRDTVFNRGYEPGNFSETMAAQGRSMILLEITCHRGDRIWERTDEELVKATVRGLERVGLVQRSEVRETLVHRIPHTYPLYDLGYRERVRSVLDYVARFPGLVSTGRQGLFLHNNMDHSIHMGFKAAEAVMSETADKPGEDFYGQISRFQQFRIVD